MSNTAHPNTRSKRNRPTRPEGTSHLVGEPGNQAVQMLLPMESAFHLKAAFADLLTEAGVLLINAFITDEVERLAGPRYAHDDGQAARRHGTAEGHVIVAGQKIAVQRPRLREDGQEVPLTSYQLFSDPRTLSEEAYKAMMLGVSTRDYRASVEAFGDGYGIDKSSVSRHFQAASAKELKLLVERPLGDEACTTIMIDGVHFAGTVFIVALGVNENGYKRLLGLWSGESENAAVVGGLLDDMIARGLSCDREYLFVIDGSPALAKAIRSRFGSHVAIQRCRIHKKKNILGHLPKQHHAGASMRLATAWGCVDYNEAKEELGKALAFLESINTHAARSLEEAFEETLTVQRLGVPAKLQPHFSNTNMIENLFSSVRKRTRNVKNWQDRPAKGRKKQDMRERWAASALLESEKKFRRVRHHRLMPGLAAAVQSLDDRTESA